MQCPLCGGPLHVESSDRFACERGHVLDGRELAQSSATRVTVAFWMAIEALETEAATLRLLEPGDNALADQAAEDARVLRDLANTRASGRSTNGDG